MACVLCLASWNREGRKEWYYIKPEDAHPDNTYQCWVCPPCVRSVQRDLRKDFRSDGHTEADFEAEVISLVNMEKSRHWGGGWIAASEGMDCRS